MVENLKFEQGGRDCLYLVYLCNTRTCSSAAQGEQVFELNGAMRIGTLVLQVAVDAIDKQDKECVPEKGNLLRLCSSNPCRRAVS